MDGGGTRASMDRVVAAAMAGGPQGEVVRFLSLPADQPDVIWVGIGRSASAAAEENRWVALDARTAEPLRSEAAGETGVMDVILRLHVDLYAGLPGKLFLGAMGLLFVVATVSGVVVYGPFTRRLGFGEVRAQRPRRIRWLDLHNLMGIATVVWALLVGVTGVVETLADVVLGAWRVGQLAEMTAPYAGQPPVERLGSVEAALQGAQAALPGTDVAWVAFPGTDYSSQHHLAVFMRGRTPLTSRLYEPVLVDAATGEVTDVRAPPWYVTLVFLAQPLHFGDYGGLPLKVVWALLDLVVVALLATGFYLWVARRAVPLEARLAPEEPAPAQAAAAVEVAQ
ncbi:MAG: PepSY-associated TM helix domain-containing protein [Anaeromyxobacter sp.]